MTVTDIIAKILDLVKVAEKVDLNSKVGKVQLHQLSNRVKYYTNMIDKLVLSSIYEVKYTVDNNENFARLTNISENEVKGVIISLWKLRKVNKDRIKFLEIKRIPTYFFSG